MGFGGGLVADVAAFIIAWHLACAACIQLTMSLKVLNGGVVIAESNCRYENELPFPTSSVVPVGCLNHRDYWMQSSCIAVLALLCRLAVFAYQVAMRCCNTHVSLC